MRASALLLAVAAQASGLAGQDLNPSIPFAKLMNPAFAVDYSDISISTNAQFVSPDPTPGYVWGSKIEEATAGLVGFQVVAPGQKLPTATGQLVPHAFLPKAAADILFEMKPGEAIILTGHPCISEPGPSFVVFIADSITREPGPE
jgi:hypothetical protein